MDSRSFVLKNKIVIESLICIASIKLAGVVYMANQKSLLDYDERYKKVYEAGGVFWNEHSPNPRLLNFITSLPKGSKCIDLGCGEGHEARTLAKLGFAVTGIDLSPIVIARNTLITPSDLSVDFFVGDVTDLQAIGISDQTFDFALDMG